MKKNRKVGRWNLTFFRLTSFTSFQLESSLQSTSTSYFHTTTFRIHGRQLHICLTLRAQRSVSSMAATVNEIFCCPNMSELTHFGEHGANTFTTSSIPIPDKKCHENNNFIIMSVDSTFEPEKDMNCLDILAGVVSRCSSSEVEQKPLAFTTIGGVSAEINRSASERSDTSNPQEHRVSCHRCGNIRKRKIVCERPQVICFVTLTRCKEGNLISALQIRTDSFN